MIYSNYLIKFERRNKINPNIRYAKSIIKKYGGNGIEASSVADNNTIGEIAKLVLTTEQYNKLLLDEGAKWNEDALGKDEYYKIVEEKK